MSSNATRRPIRIKGRENKKDGGHYWNTIGNAWVDDDKITLNFFGTQIIGPNHHIVIGLKDREDRGDGDCRGRGGT